MGTPYITIVTATYNRASLLPDVFHSLCSQTNKDFVWMVVDDGSSDNTEHLVRSWIDAPKEFKIVYYKMSCNGGKNRAINFAVDVIKSPYVVILDSDDYLERDAVDFFIKKGKEVFQIENLAGIGTLKKTESGIQLNESLGGGYIDVDNLQRRNHRFELDGCEMFKTSILKRFPFEVWRNEKFSPEEIVWDSIAMAGYSLRWYDKATCVARYQPDGLTKGWELLSYQNPMGYYMLYKHKMKLDKSFRARCANAYNMIAFAVLGNEPCCVFNCSLKYYFVILVMFPFGLISGFRWKLRYKRIQNQTL